MSLPSFQVLGINHLGIAAKDPLKFAWFMKDVLGVGHLGDESVVEQKTLTSMFTSKGHGAIGSQGDINSGSLKDSPIPRLELLVPLAGTQDGPIHKYLEKKGGGIHHIAIQVSNVDAAIAFASSKGVKMIDMTPRSGAHNTRIAFVHPESTGGILFEFVQEL
ncbi:MAG: VOC family protein [Proteobacteria bacterium]|nr:VOC family protein [Pseudomonadota bacterium]